MSPLLPSPPVPTPPGFGRKRDRHLRVQLRLRIASDVVKRWQQQPGQKGQRSPVSTLLGCASTMLSPAQLYRLRCDVSSRLAFIEVHNRDSNLVVAKLGRLLTSNEHREELSVRVPKSVALAWRQCDLAEPARRAAMEFFLRCQGAGVGIVAMARLASDMPDMVREMGRLQASDAAKAMTKRLGEFLQNL